MLPANGYRMVNVTAHKDRRGGGGRLHDDTAFDELHKWQRTVSKTNLKQGNEKIVKRIFLSVPFYTISAFACVAYAAEPTCRTQTLASHTSKLCVSHTPFQHDYYTLWVDGNPLFTLPDDYVENVTLTHRIPDDAAIEFPLSKQGSPTVTISGGCTPISEQQNAGGKMIGVEVGRSCSFTWGEVDVLKDLQIRF